MAYYRAQSEEDELEFIENFPEKIKYLENPSEKTIWTALENDAMCIEFIKNPSIEMIKFVIGRNPKTFRFSDRPEFKCLLNEDIYKLAVKLRPFNIAYIYEPSEEVQILALKNCWYKNYYEVYIEHQPKKSKWFYRELNRLKLIKGPLQ